ncbi:MAG: glycosyltransferase [Cyclobacteriaceae bacterium]|nr:glycosyltransferase [Cyclobacteriaceae bacterium]
MRLTAPEHIREKRIGYLSGAPRISTHPKAEMSGPKSHILGFVLGFKSLGWDVDEFIVGNHVPKSWVIEGSEHAISRNFVSRLIADIVRLALGWVNSKIAWQVIDSRVDFVYERVATFQFLGSVFKKRGVMWILETNGPLYFEAKHERNSLVLDKIAKSLEVKCYKNCDTIVCVTETIKAFLIAELGIPSSKIFVMPNAVNTEVFDPAKYKPNKIFDGFTIGFVGRMYDYQGLEMLLQAADELNSEGIAIHLVFVGDGIVRSGLEEQTRNSKIAKLVHFEGRVAWDSVPEYIMGFDVCYSGQVEMQIGLMYHSPLKIYEYMSMGKTVIASAFDDARSVISDRKNGFLFEPGNVLDLKSAIRSAYEMRHSLPDMGLEARESMVANHSWAKRIKGLIEHIDSIEIRNQE